MPFLSPRLISGFDPLTPVSHAPVVVVSAASNNFHHFSVGN